MPSSTFLALQMNHSATLPRLQISRRENIAVCPQLDQDAWVLNTINGHHLPLCRWPQSHYTNFSPTQDQVCALQAEVEELIEKEAALMVPRAQMWISSPIFVVPKSGGGYRPICDLRYLNTHIEAPHFKMEGLHILSTVVQQDWR